MAGESRWIFTRAQLIDTPSRKCGIDSDKELNYRQQTANFIQDMGQRLQVTQLCINTAIVYMHRFYMFHSFTKFNRNNMASACLFLAAKVEEQPRKLEHVLKVAHMCLHRESLDPKSETYLEQAQDLVVNENILLQTLGFDIQVDHPHTHVVKTCSLVRASKDLAQTSYFLATNSLHLTSMCLQNKPTVVACVCIHLACKWSNWEIPQSNEGREWFWYTDKDVTLELLEALTQDFLTILDRCPSKLKKKILTWKSGRDGAEGAEPTPLSTCRKPSSSAAGSVALTSAASVSTSIGQVTAGTPSLPPPPPPPSSSSVRGQARRNPVQQPSQPGTISLATTGETVAVGIRPTQLTATAGDPSMRRVKTEPVLTHQSMTPKEYRERKERERKERELREQQRLQQHHAQHTAKPAAPVNQAPGSSIMLQETKERHHMDIFTPASGEQKPLPQDTGSQGGDGGSGQRTRERPHGEQHHRSHQGTTEQAHRGRGHDPPHHRHQGALPHHRSSQQPGGYPSQQLNHPDRHHQHSTDKMHEHANNGHSEAHRVGHGMSGAPTHVKTEVKTEVRTEVKTDSQDGFVHREVPNAQPSHGEYPPSSSQHQKDLKIKINRKSHSVSPSTDTNVDKGLKMKIKLPVSPSMARREERAQHKTSPLTVSDGLKLKLDLKGHRPARDMTTNDRHSHSKPGGGHPEMSGSERGEYQLSNQGSNSLKLVISKGKLSGSSDSPGSDKSSKRHHSHHHSRSSDKHHSRKRSAPAASPQDTSRIASTARGSNMALGHHPSKMHRTDSGSDLRSHLNVWPDGHLPQTNGAYALPAGSGGAPDTQVQLEQIQKTQQQLQQLIELHQQNLIQSQLQPPHNTNYGQPPLPPPGDGSVPPPPPPPPTELPPLPPYSYN